MVTMSQKEFQRVKVIENAAGGRLSVTRSLPPAATEPTPGAAPQTPLSARFPRLGAARQSRTLHALGGFYSPEAVDLEPGVDSVAAGERLRVRSASCPLHSQSLSPVGTLSDSWSPSLQGDKVWLQLWGDIILEHLHPRVLARWRAAFFLKVRLHWFN